MTGAGQGDGDTISLIKPRLIVAARMGAMRADLAHDAINEIAELEDRNASLLREVEGLKAALDKYGRHFGWCASISSRNTAEGCSCGFDAALSPASGGV